MNRTLQAYAKDVSHFSENFMEACFEFDEEDMPTGHDTGQVKVGLGKELGKRFGKDSERSSESLSHLNLSDNQKGETMRLDPSMATSKVVGPVLGSTTRETTPKTTQEKLITQLELNPNVSGENIHRFPQEALRLHFQLVSTAYKFPTNS